MNPRKTQERGPQSGVLGYFVRHHTAANLLLLLLLIAGFYASTRIRAQFFPDVAVDTITVSVSWTGAGPKEMDEAIVARIEPGLRAVEGVKTATASARQGTASVSLEFETGWDIARAMDDVRLALDEVRDLPDDAEQPTIRPSRWRDRVTDVLISGDVGIELLQRTAEELQDQLFREGVTLTSISGLADNEIRIDVRPADLERYQLTLQDISTAIKAETGTLPVGQIETTGARVRASARELTPEQLSSISIRATPDGGRITLRDVADVSEEGLDRAVAHYHNGDPAVILEINRDESGDALAIQASVEKVIEEFRPSATRGISFEFVNPRAKEISARLNILISNGLWGLAIVVVLLFLFLSARTAFWVAAGVPVAMAATLALMFVFGFTFNMISLFALIICLGIVVDDAIVVGEHADHLARRGLPPDEAAASAASRMAAPVFSASITTVIAFAALALIGGRFGRLVYDIPFTVAVVILASLLESFLILPAHMRHALTNVNTHSIIDTPSRIVNRGLDWFKENIFRAFIRGVVFMRYPVIAAGVLLLSLSASALLDKTVRWKFFDSPERATIRANVAMLDNAVRADTKDMVTELDRALQVVNKRYQEKFGHEPVETAVAKIGATTGRGLKSADTKDIDLLAGYDIELIDPDLRSYSASEFINDWKREITSHPLLETLALRGDRSGPGGDAISIRLSGADENTLKAAAEDIKSSLARYPAASSIEDDLPYDRPELMVSITPKGEALGFTTANVADALRQHLEGIEAIKLAKDGREVIARVRLPRSDLGPAYLHRAKLPLAGGGFISLDDVATVTEAQSFSTIRRENGDRNITVTGDLPDDAAKSAEVMTALQSQILPDVASRHGLRWSLGGMAEQESAFLNEALTGLLLGLGAIYAVLAWVFASWSRPMIIMLVIPFGLIGAIWGHYLHGVPLSMFSLVGLIGMAGIIINDSIVLITTIDERTPTSNAISAIVEGTSDRLRAVLLTTLTTVGGLAPLLFETSRQAQFLKPTVITLAYGLGFGVILVLLLTPAMLAVQHDLSMWLKSMRRWPAVLRRRSKNAAV